MKLKLLVFVFVLPLSVFADKPLNETVKTPDDMFISGAFWLSDQRWKVDTPSHTFRWVSLSQEMAVSTSCEVRFRRSTEDAHALVLYLCDGFEGFEDDAILWIFSDWGDMLWGIYEEDVYAAIKEANYYFASAEGGSAEDGSAGKLTVWDGDFETVESGGSPNLSSWGRIKYSLSP